MDDASCHSIWGSVRISIARWQDTPPSIALIQRLVQFLKFHSNISHQKDVIQTTYLVAWRRAASCAAASAACRLCSSSAAFCAASASNLWPTQKCILIDKFLSRRNSPSAYAARRQPNRNFHDQDLATDLTHVRSMREAASHALGS